MKEISNQANQKREGQRWSERVIGFDNHPDSFTAAFLRGTDAEEAEVVKVQDKIAQERLEEWILTHTTPRDVIVMEASANSFESVKVIERHGRRAVVLESAQCGKIGVAYCATDRVDAIKLARVYLSRLSKRVWVPGEKTRQRREVFYAHQAAVKDSTRARQRMRGFLNARRIRLPKGFKLTASNALEKLLGLRAWEPTQRLLLTQYHQALREAHLRRSQLREVMAAELIQCPSILRLIRLCGLRHVAAFALAAFIGDITRFANPRKLAAYIGVNPGVCDSGATKGSGQLRRNGCAPLRALMVQAAQTILRTPGAAFAKWGYQLALRRGRNRAVIGVARKLVTAVWYCLSGQFSALEDVPQNVNTKLGLLISGLGSLRERILAETDPAAFHAALLQSLRESHPLVFRSSP